jgi:hypothetical protein
MNRTDVKTDSVASSPEVKPQKSLRIRSGVKSGTDLQSMDPPTGPVHG